MTRVIDDESGIHFQCAKVIVEGHDKTIDIWPLTYIGLWMAMKFQRLPLCSHWCLSTQLLSVSIQFSGVLIFVEKSCVEFKYGFTWISWLLSTYFHSQLNLEHKVIKKGERTILSGDLNVFWYCLRHIPGCCHPPSSPPMMSSTCLWE